MSKGKTSARLIRTTVPNQITFQANVKIRNDMKDLLNVMLAATDVKVSCPSCSQFIPSIRALSDSQRLWEASTEAASWQARPSLSKPPVTVRRYGERLSGAPEETISIGHLMHRYTAGGGTLGH